MYNYNPFSLQGKTILVTGASSGIGRAAAIECSKMGATVIAVGRNEDRLKETLSKIETENSSFYVCDLTDSSSVEQMIAEMPYVDGLINNAGIGIVKPIKFINETDFTTLLKADTIAPILLLQKMVKKKKINKGGSVVFTSSMAALGGVTNGNSMYVACKGAISSFVLNAALELGPQNIRVNAVCPAMVNTPLVHDGDSENEEHLKEMEKQYPLKKFGEPEDVAWAMIYLLSDAARWVTGTNMVVDGGFSIVHIG